MSEHTHLYTTPSWRRARAAFLADHPTCRLCAQAGRVTAATVVDHVTPHRGDMELFWDTDNWQAVCATCHSGTKQSGERTGKPMRGCDPDGAPLDASHHWGKA